MPKDDDWSQQRKELQHFSDKNAAHMRERMELLQQELDRRFSAVSDMNEERQATLDTRIETAVQSLRELTIQRFTDNDKALEAALLSAEKAVGKAEIANEKRLDAVNEFRGQLTDQAATFISRTEFTAGINAGQDAIGELRDQLGKLSNQVVPRAENEARWQALTEKFEASYDRTAHSVQALSARIDRQSGVDAGTRDVSEIGRANKMIQVQWVFIAVALIGIAISILIKFH